MNPQDTQTARVIHIDFVAVADNKATPELLDALFVEAGSLAQLDEVVDAGVIEGAPGSDFELAFLFVLRDFAALEPFGTKPAYAKFLQGYVAPVLRQLAGADVRLEGEMPAIQGPASCIALAASDETYDWEVSSALRDWAKVLSPDSRAIGLAVGERQRYRGVAIAFGSAKAERLTDELMTSTLIIGEARSLT